MTFRTYSHAVMMRGTRRMAAELTTWFRGDAGLAMERARNASQALIDGVERPEIVLAEMLAKPMAHEPDSWRARAIERTSDAWRRAIGNAVPEVAA